VTGKELAAALLSGELNERRFRKVARHLNAGVGLTREFLAALPDDKRDVIKAGIRPHVAWSLTELE
jgi:hypothetical protein